MTINWEVIIWTCITLAVLMSIIGLILYAISAKNVRSKRKELGEVHTELKVGSRIMFAGGVYGKVVSIDDEDTLRVEVTDSRGSYLLAYQSSRRSFLGKYILSPGFTPKASYHMSICGSAPLTRHSPRAWGSLFVRLRISFSVMLAAHTPE